MLPRPFFISLYKTIDLKRTPEFVPEYVGLRNRYCNALLTTPVDIEGTMKWLGAADVEIVGLLRRDSFAGAAILYPERNGEVAIFTDKKDRGMAGLLLPAIEDRAAASGLPAVHSWTLLSNIAAQKAFQENGFSRAGVSERRFNGHHYVGVEFEKRIAWCVPLCPSGKKKGLAF